MSSSAIDPYILNPLQHPQEQQPQNNGVLCDCNAVVTLVNPILVKLGIQRSYEELLMQAITQDNHREVRRLCQLGADIDTTSFHPEGKTPLMHAVENNSLNCLRVLILSGADVNKRSKSRDKVTALFLALNTKNKETQVTQMRMLLEHGAKPDLMSVGGGTPFSAACFYANETAIEMLLKYHPNFNIITCRQSTALDLAISKLGQHHPLVQKMIRLGAKRLAELEDQDSASTSQSLENHHMKLHPKIDPSDVFPSGYLLPRTARDAVHHYQGEEKKIKKYDARFPSLSRSVIRGKSNYILYDSSGYLTACDDCQNRIKLNNFLGRGGQAKIKIGQDLSSGKFVAVRVASSLGPHELEILEMMGLLIDYIHIDGKHYIIQELLDGVPLFTYIHSQEYKKNSAAEVYKIINSIMMQLLTQLDLLHRNGFIHRDLTPDNIIVDPDTGKVTLIDFGFAIKEPNFQNGYAFLMIWKEGFDLAPELDKITLTGRLYSPQSDIHALGHIFTRMLVMCMKNDVYKQGEPLCQQMLSNSPEERGDAAYYLDIFRSFVK